MVIFAASIALFWLLTLLLLPDLFATLYGPENCGDAIAPVAGVPLTYKNRTKNDGMCRMIKIPDETSNTIYEGYIFARELNRDFLKIGMTVMPSHDSFPADAIRYSYPVFYKIKMTPHDDNWNPIQDRAPILSDSYVEVKCNRDFNNTSHTDHLNETHELYECEPKTIARFTELEPLNYKVKITFLHAEHLKNQFSFIKIEAKNVSQAHMIAVSFFKALLVGISILYFAHFRILLQDNIFSQDHNFEQKFLSVLGFVLVFFNDPLTFFNLLDPYDASPLIVA